jgi:hypothetical protein
MSNAFYWVLALYLLLQSTAIWTLRGRWRSVAWIGIWVMATAIILMLLGLARGTYLSPIYVALAVPAATCGLIALLAVHFAWTRLHPSHKG